MVQCQSILSVPVTWRGKKFVLELNLEASLKELGEELQTLTDVKAETMKLIIPQSSTKSARLLVPFSDEHSGLRLQDTGIIEGKPIRMMGVSESEVDQVLKDAKADLRIAGFEEEEKRMKQRISKGPQFSLELPQGPYIFCDFQTLELPGIELNPPPSEALKRMHMLAADPGIVAIMNKHRWRVGIMTEMAPVGYVGISPKCILGFNKNHGEEISLRLRTDDLKGFRKYESIKKTLLHELAHMVYSEHDANFYALNKLLNQEAFALDWTRSRSHTLADSRFSGHDDLEMFFESERSLPQKLGGETSQMVASARAASVAAAYHRLADSSSIPRGYTDDTNGNSSPVGALKKGELFVRNQHDGCSNQDSTEPDPDDSEAIETMNLEPYSEVSEGIYEVKPNPDETEMGVIVPRFTPSISFGNENLHDEPDPDDSEVTENVMVADTGFFNSQSMQIENNAKRIMGTIEEPDPDDSEGRHNAGSILTPNTINNSRVDQSQLRKVYVEPDPDDSQGTNIWQTSPDLDDEFEHQPQIMSVIADEPDPDDEELRRIQDPVTLFCNRLTKAIQMLNTELNPSGAMTVLQTLFKIIRNLSEHPDEIKYKRLRKANPVFQRSIVNHEAALEVLFLVGFSEEVVTDEMGKAETYLMLKRNDPGLLWLAKSSLETSIAK